MKNLNLYESGSLMWYYEKTYLKNEFWPTIYFDPDWGWNDEQKIYKMQDERNESNNIQFWKCHQDFQNCILVMELKSWIEGGVIIPLNDW